MTKTKRRGPLQTLRDLRREFQHISLQVATGTTLDTALRNRQRALQTPAVIARQWHFLRAAVTEGNLPARAGVEAFVALLDIHHLCLSEMQKRGLNAKIQARVIGGLSLVLILAVAALMEAPLLSLSNLAAVGLCAAGYASLHFIGRRLKKTLWRLEWLLLWFYVGTLIECGMTPAQAMTSSLEWCSLTPAVPAPLRTEARRLGRKLRQGEIYSAAPACTAIDPMDSDILEHFARAVQDGISSARILKSYHEHYSAWLRSELQESAEKSAYLNLIPLYLCFAPAMFLVLFGQLVIAMGEAT